MQTKIHSLISPASGTQRTLHSLHYGQPQVGEKVYLQASLHADELPGMLVIHHLRALLDAAEKRGDVLGEVVLVPMANPIGLNQTVMRYQLGRFELASMANFNRHYPDFAQAIEDRLHGKLTSDAQNNTRIIRAAMQDYLNADSPKTELESLRNQLMRLSCDADVVLDLHCDFEAAMHLYTEVQYADAAAPLAAYLGARAFLTAKGAGGPLISFDEALSGVWWRLQEKWGAQFPIPLACMSTTVELRGQTDVSHPLAQSDANAIYHYMQSIDVLVGDAPPPPAPLCQATPLSGTESICAPHPGVIVFTRDVGEALVAGDTIAHIIEPLSGKLSEVKTSVDGVLYARHNLRWATTDMEVCRVAGKTPIRFGNLLSP